MKPIHIVIVSIVVLVLAGIAAVAASISGNKKQNDPNYTGPDTESGSGSSGSGSSGSKTVSLNRDKPIGVGSSGPEVEYIQKLYNASRYVSTPLVVDGKFGSKTLNAVIKVMGFGTTQTTVNKFEARLKSEAAGTDGSFFSIFGYKL